MFVLDTFNVCVMLAFKNSIVYWNDSDGFVLYRAAKCERGRNHCDLRGIVFECDVDRHRGPEGISDGQYCDIAF